MSCCGDEGCCCYASKFEDKHQNENYPTVVLQPQELKQAQDALLKGVQFHKFCANGACKEKYLNLDRDRTRLTYTPSSKPVRETTIYIKDIVEIRDTVQGSSVPATKVFQYAEDTENMHCFAIIHRAAATGGEGGRRCKSFNIGFDQEADKKKYMQTVAFLAMRTRRDYTRDPQAMRMLELWMEADKDADKRLSLKEISELLQKLNVQLERSQLREKFDEADKDQSGFLNFDEFRHFYDQLTRRKEVVPLFRKYAIENGKKGESEVMSARELAKFLCGCQGVVGFNEDQARQLIQGIADPKAKGLTIAQFTNYLFNKTMNSWWKPQHRVKVYQDMSQPLHHYFISSSHNTYLTGDQLKSRSSTEMYKIVLEKGCRCVELDCHDSTDSEPIIYHGHTRTTRIKFADVCKVINEYAFKTSEYPVILSLEVHCGPEGQEVMAKHMQDIFKETVRSPSGEMKTVSRIVTLGKCMQQTYDAPHQEFTPKALKRKIIIKAKMKPEHYRVEMDKGEQGEDSEEEEKEESPEVKVERERSKQQHHQDPHQPKRPVHEALSKLVFLRSTKMDRTGSDWARKNKPHEIVSLAEGASTANMKVKDNAYVEANKRMMTRIYPAGHRIFSDNYEPWHHWNAGCSIVALNWQRLDYPMRLNEAKFEQNGKCGYILKPEAFRQQDFFTFRQRVELKVKVVSGSQIPKPKLDSHGEIVDPYVALWITGMQQDTTFSQWQRTDTIHNNGFNPVWNKSITFAINCVEMAMLTLRVIDADRTGRDNPIAEASIPLMSLACGYRCVPLRAVVNNEPIDHACLFCHFALEQSDERS